MTRLLNSAAPFTMKFFAYPTGLAGPYPLGPPGTTVTPISMDGSAASLAVSGSAHAIVFVMRTAR
jgi:hypothetical protein